METSYLFALILNTTDGCTFYLKDINKEDEDDYRLELTRHESEAGLFPFSTVRAQSIREIYINKAFICNEDLSDLIADGKVKPVNKYFEFSANSCNCIVKARQVNVNIVSRQYVVDRAESSECTDDIFMTLKSKSDDKDMYISLIDKNSTIAFTDLKNYRRLYNIFSIESHLKYLNENDVDIVRRMSRKDFNEYVTQAKDITGIKVISTNNDMIIVSGQEDDYSIDVNHQMKYRFDIEYIQTGEPIGELIDVGVILKFN